MSIPLRFAILSLLVPAGLPAQDGPLPGTQPLTWEGDLSVRMVAGISRFLDEQTDAAAANRAARWKRDLTSAAAYKASIAPHRERLATMLGVVDPRVAGEDGFRLDATMDRSSLAGSRDDHEVHRVRWDVLPGIEGEGLLIRPVDAGSIRARAVVLPDADETPEALADTAFVHHLAHAGVEMVLPALINRDDTWSGNERVGRWTNQPHREWIYRQAFVMGRHVIGYEIQKVLAAVDVFAAVEPALPIGVTGFHEGGSIALHAAALDPRIQSCLVSGYFGDRQALWSEPIYRNVFGYLREFGDAEVASLIAPRALVLEHVPVPEITGPPPLRPGRAGAAPGRWTTPGRGTVEAEWERAKTLVAGLPEPALITGIDGDAVEPGSPETISTFLANLGLRRDPAVDPPSPLEIPVPGDRQKRQVRQLEAHVQQLLRFATYEREQTFWNPLRKDPGLQEGLRRQFREEVIGWFDTERLPLNPRSRFLEETDAWTAHEVVLDVWEPGVFAWGYLLVPKDLAEGERRPVVVCQHGLEGLPEHVIETDPDSRAWRAYKAYAARLAEEGCIVFAPHNPYRGKDDFRVLQRKLNPLGRTLFSVITRQHEAILDWLGEQPFVDPDRIGFYGLSYGGKSAMRIPALETRYALSICSADFNEWVWKNTTVDWRGSYVFTGEYEIFEWDLGHTFNYAEMAALIAPRPFMVERGHGDGVGIDEQVAFEFGKVRRHYDALGVGDRTAIEWFNGPHTIHGVGTFEFLRQHLGPWR